jgi:hypothetical protein
MCFLLSLEVGHALHMFIEVQLWSVQSTRGHNHASNITQHGATHTSDPGPRFQGNAQSESFQDYIA